MNFNELNLRAPIQRAITEFGYTTPSPIQQKAIPPVLEGRDLIGCAQTGTGKTAAFALPMLERLSQGRRAKAGEIRALILTPTRELALQIGQNFTNYGKYTGLRHAVIFGGVGQQPQVVALKKGLDVLIACPGRLNDLSNQGFVNLKNLEIFVLDEADRMLDMGFVHDVKRVVAKLPPKRQNLMFSATMPKEIEALASTFLTKPVMVKVNPVSSTVEKIEQSLYFVEKGNKLSLLIHLIKELNLTNALVFSRTKHGADKIVKQLEKAGITAAAIHGNKGQNARVTALENFKAGKIQVLVATDIAARGIDINELSHVFNFDLPEVAETYVHRIGRTARAGADGVAISFCASEEREYLQGIEKLNRKKIPVVQDHPWAGKPSPVKAILTPVRGKKPVADAAPQNKKERGGAQPSRKIAQAASPAPHQEKEEQMNQNDNRGKNRGRNQNRDNRDAKAQQNGQGGAGQARSGQEGRNGQGTRNNNNRGGRDHRNAAPAQPKFDPRFLTPQAAEQIPHAAAAPRAAEPEMLDVRRMNQNRDSRNDRGGRDNRGGQNNRNNRNANNRNANGRDTNRDERGNNQNRDNRNGNRPTAPQGGAPRTNQQGRPAQNAGGSPNNRNQGARDNRGANPRDERNPRDNRNNNRNDRNDRRGEPARGGQAKSAGKVGHSGLQTVRSGKPMRTNEKDPGLVLITKKPPQQKFTDFDSYMSAHGGVSAPVEEYGDK